MLGWLPLQSFWIEVGTLFLIQFFGNSLIFGQLDGFVWRLWKRPLFYGSCLTKDKSTSLQTIFIYNMDNNSVYFPFIILHWQLFIPIAVRCFLRRIAGCYFTPITVSTPTTKAARTRWSVFLVLLYYS
jgi:hypothetical protein